MLQMVIVGLLLLVGVALIVFANTGGRYQYSDMAVFGVILCTVCIVYGILFGLISYEHTVDMQVFKSQQEYLANHIPENDIENAALTQKKLELNEWLYQAQISRNNLGDFSSYPVEVFQLEPIQ